MNNLAKLRKARRLTFTDLSIATGIVRSTLSEIENGKRRMTDKHARILADFFGCEVDYVLGADSIRGSEAIHGAVTNLKEIYAELFYAGKLDQQDSNIYILLKASAELPADKIAELALHASRLLVSTDFNKEV